MNKKNKKENKETKLELPLIFELTEEQRKAFEEMQEDAKLNVLRKKVYQQFLRKISEEYNLFQFEEINFKMKMSNYNDIKKQLENMQDFCDWNTEQRDYFVKSLQELYEFFLKLNQVLNFIEDELKE